jgi:type VI protein secretion system component Hcp
MMNAQENLKNDESNFQADTLTDLPVTDEQAGNAKGGGDDMPTEEVSFNFGQVKVRPPQRAA